MKRTLVLLLLFAAVLYGKGLERPANLSQARNVIKVIHFDYQVHLAGRLPLSVRPCDLHERYDPGRKELFIG